MSIINYQVKRFFDPTAEVVKLIAKGDLLYIAYANEIVVLSIKRLIGKKDIIKKRITFNKFIISDPLTTAFNDNDQTKFCSLAFKEDSYPILHSSNLEKRIKCLNSESPQIVDFYLVQDEQIVLWNNGALSCGFVLLNDFVKAVAIWNDKLSFYRNNELIIVNDSVELNQVYKDEMRFKYGLIVLYNSETIFLCNEQRQSQIINFQGALQVEIINSNTLYILKETIIYEYHIGSYLKQIKLQMNFISKFFIINETDFLFKNGSLFINNSWSKVSKVVSVCSSYNGVVEFLCLKEQSSQSINCLIIEKTPQKLFQLMIAPLLEHNFSTPYSIYDFQIYYFYFNHQVQTLEITKSLFEKKKKISDSFFVMYKQDDVKRAQGIVLLNLLHLLQKTDLFKEIYLQLYIMFLEQKKLDKGKIQIDLLRKKQINDYLTNDDICPICNKQLISWQNCPNHTFIRCSTTLKPIYLQPLWVCKSCELQTTEQLKLCPVCCCEMKKLL